MLEAKVARGADLMIESAFRGVSNKNAEAVVTTVADYSGVPAEDILSSDRSAHLVRLRTIIFLALRGMGWSYPRIAKQFNRDHTTVRHACLGAPAKLEKGDRELVAELSQGFAAVASGACSDVLLRSKVRLMVDKAAALYADKLPLWLLRYYCFAVMAKLFDSRGWSLTEISDVTHAPEMDVKSALELVDSGENEVIGQILAFAKAFLNVSE